jgi:hypothetical protein
MDTNPNSKHWKKVFARFTFFKQFCPGFILPSYPYGISIPVPYLKFKTPQKNYPEKSKMLHF